jgi:hypothetical protein
MKKQYCSCFVIVLVIIAQVKNYSSVSADGVSAIQAKVNQVQNIDPLLPA